MPAALPPLGATVRTSANDEVRPDAIVIGYGTIDTSVMPLNPESVVYPVIIVMHEGTGRIDVWAQHYTVVSLPKSHMGQGPLVGLIGTIEATGGVIRDSRGVPVPVADEDWSDLAAVYLQACKLLGRTPRISDPAAE